ncbi:MAG TPA: cysteine desulfurase [Candidatus Nanoarchaeia archaeon]|nr:cysteine desulfurase [Candidatus Nanoarchaeia archaeon]
MKSKIASSKALNQSGLLKDFPILSRKINGKRLIYLDNAATSQKPVQVIKALTDYYENYNANVHRGVHTLSVEATEAYENSRNKIARFVNAEREEIIFTKNTTESSNLVLYSWAMENLSEGDEIALSVMEHHSNLVPWQQLQKKGVKLNYIDINSNGELQIEQARKLIGSKTKLVCIGHASNVLGTINPVKELAKLAHDKGALIYVDGAQAAPHLPVDVKDLNVDFYSFSAHKMLGPTGIGILYGKKSVLENMKPFMYGGDMIREVELFETRYNDLPYKFEAGTPNIADAIAFGTAIDYLTKIGMQNIAKHEQKLVSYAMPKLTKINGLTLYGPKEASKRVGVVSFSLRGIHPHDVASILDAEGVEIRSGHLCCQPLMKRLGVDALARASTYFYNTEEDIDALVEGIKKVQKVFA